MPRLKTDYGIDLGTTNSAICRMEKGVPTIIKTDTLKDTMPSCVLFTKKKTCAVGDSAYNTYNQSKRGEMKDVLSGEVRNRAQAYVEFKRYMATDKQYHNNFMERSYSPVELSAEVLKTLKSFVTDETVGSIVVTVPAKFTQNQKAATMEAARMAGFKKCELLQEPIAAAYAYGLGEESKEGLWMVFDFGGGTFDVALLRADDGILTVFDTEGDNYLGGKNLDYAIVDELLIPYLEKNYDLNATLADKAKREVVREAMKTFAERAKNQLSFKESEAIISDLGDLGEDESGEEIELDLTLTREEVYRVMRPIFQKAVDICLDILKRNNLSGGDLNKLILVGGPTHSGLIRDMLREQITPNVDTSADPMTVVARGAALYASNIDADVSQEEIADEAVRLELTFDSTTVDEMMPVAVKLLDDEPRGQVFVEMTRNVGAKWASGKIDVDHTGNIIEAELVENKANSFSVMCYDETGNALKCFPDEITITQGTKVSAAVLPYNYGVGVWNRRRQRLELMPVRGLEKNRPLPAVGVVSDLKTTSVLRPGVEEDVMRVSLYQVDYVDDGEGRPVYLYNPVDQMVASGDDVAHQIKEGSSLNLTIRIDSSEAVTMEVFFPDTDDDIELKKQENKVADLRDTDRLIDQYSRQGWQQLVEMRDAGIDVADLKTKMDDWQQERDRNTEVMMIMSHLKEVLRLIDERSRATEWVRIEQHLNRIYRDVQESQREAGDSETGRRLEELSRAVDDVTARKDIVMACDVIKELNRLFVDINRLNVLIDYIRHYHHDFSCTRWKNAAKARQLLTRGMQMIQYDPTIDTLQPIVNDISDCMVDPVVAGSNDNIEK